MALVRFFVAGQKATIREAISVIETELWMNVST